MSRQAKDKPAVTEQPTAPAARVDIDAIFRETDAPEPSQDDAIARMFHGETSVPSAADLANDGDDVAESGPPPVAQVTPAQMAADPSMFETRDRTDHRYDGDDYAAFSRALKAQVWINRQRVEWLKMRDGRCHVVTREYRVERILLDVFSTDNRTVRLEILDKVQGIERYNREHPDRPFGYVAAIRGVEIPAEVMDAVKAHRVVDQLVGGQPISVIRPAADVRVVA